MHEKWIVITLFSLILISFGMSFASAAEPTSKQTLMDQKNVQEHTNYTTKTTNQTNNIQMAAGEVTNYSNNTTTEHRATVSITQNQLKGAASNVKGFISKNGRLPNYVTIAGNQISMPQYLQLIAQGTLALKNGQNIALILKDVDLTIKPSETVRSGNIQKTEYVKLAKNILIYMNDNDSTPSYINSSLGKISYESLVFMFSKIVVFHDANGRLPNYVSVNSGINYAAGSPTSSSALSNYLVTTKNCQSTSTSIKNLAIKITAGKTSTYAKAQAIFRWVKTYLSYQFYYNTKKGALGALSSRSANCCDTTHLLVALSRAAGIPARYRYGTCHFSNGWFGHVWAQLYVNGKWYTADAVSNSNPLGSITNWNVNTYKLHATYSSLPF